MTAPDSTDRPNRLHWPPILYAIVFVAAGLIEISVAPGPLLSPLASRIIGWPLFTIGAALGIAALWRFKKVGTSFDPTAPATALATSGLYRITRNPMYLGAVFACAGIGLAWPVTSLVWLTLPLAIGLQKLAIEPEEAYLERRFGTEYKSYAASVRRWL